MLARFPQNILNLDFKEQQPAPQESSSKLKVCVDVKVFPQVEAEGKHVKE